jgi:hypothetical protein
VTRNASSSSKATLQPMEGKMTYVLYGLGTCKRVQVDFAPDYTRAPFTLG